VCELLDLPPVAGGYGLLHVINDEDGRRCTAFTTDLAWHQSWVISGRPSETTNIDGVRRPSRIWEQVPSPESSPSTTRSSGPAGPTTGCDAGDEGMAALIVSLWKAGIATLHSCQDTGVPDA
jgi:hypothetical protein